MSQQSHPTHLSQCAPLSLCTHVYQLPQSTSTSPGMFAALLISYGAPSQTITAPRFPPVHLLGFFFCCCCCAVIIPPLISRRLLCVVRFFSSLHSTRLTRLVASCSSPTMHFILQILTSSVQALFGFYINCHIPGFNPGLYSRAAECTKSLWIRNSPIMKNYHTKHFLMDFFCSM